MNSQDRMNSVMSITKGLIIDKQLKNKAFPVFGLLHIAQYNLTMIRDDLNWNSVIDAALAEVKEQRYWYDWALELSGEILKKECGLKLNNFPNLSDFLGQHLRGEISPPKKKTRDPRYYLNALTIDAAETIAEGFCLHVSHTDKKEEEVINSAIGVVAEITNQSYDHIRKKLTPIVRKRLNNRASSAHPFYQDWKDTINLINR